MQTEASLPKRIYSFWQILRRTLPAVLCVVATTSPPQAQAAAGKEVYGYDALGRLVSVTYPSGPGITYKYDSAGNRSVVAPVVTVSTDSFSMQQGVYNCGPNNCPYAFYGFTTDSPAVGTMNSRSMSGGGVLVNFYDRRNPMASYAVVWAEVSVGGFGADPGSTWLASATALGVTKMGSTASYSFASGRATWRWTTLWGFTGSGSTPVTIVHN